MRKLYLIFTLVVLFNVLAHSQNFLYKGELTNIDTSGYYHIYLSPEITSKLNYKFSDLRIYENNKKEIPYIRFGEDAMYKTAKNKHVKILQNEYKRLKKYTYLLVQNSDLSPINNLVLIAENPLNAEAWINISGSNNLKKWNILKNNARYMPEFSDSVTAEIRIDDIPESNFKYYRIFIYDYNKIIFNVYDVLNYDIGKKDNEFVEVMKPNFEQDDTTEANKTILKIAFDTPQYVDKIKLKIDKPEYYLRKSEIVKKDSSTGKRIRLQFYDQNQQDFYLCSDSTNELHLSRYYVQNLYLIINNNDDNPLHISDVTAYQKKEFVVAHLNKNKKYTLLFGNKNIPPPIYDLKFFKNQIPSDCGEVEIINIVEKSNPDEDYTMVKIKPIYLWIAFGIVIAILAIISVRMFVFSKNNEGLDLEL